ncbi:hypothetical protein DFQ09_10753 [Winogradskyella pacifica]|uniref:Uncharacterized protein n=1 Tax=Winogradskyella pacifica TaxID=664642 RepID=A0A3D9LPC2_9FLAO|nr:hypothetical protein DFQ09_10753 [Winogradskyella pacifica]
MSKSLILYIALFINLIIMIYTLLEINKIKEFKKNKKHILIYVTIFIPVLGLVLTKNEKK